MSHKNPKNALQELNPTRLPKYESVTAHGRPPHDPEWLSTVSFWSDNRAEPLTASGKGKTKMDAEMQAASNMLEHLVARHRSSGDEKSMMTPAIKIEPLEPWQTKCLELIRGTPRTAHWIRAELDKAGFKDISRTDINSFVYHRSEVQRTEFEEATRQPPMFWIPESSDSKVDAAPAHLLMVDTDTINGAPFAGFRSSVYSSLVLVSVERSNQQERNDPNHHRFARRKALRMMAALCKFPQVTVVTTDKVLQQDLDYACKLLNPVPRVEFVASALQVKLQ